MEELFKLGVYFAIIAAIVFAIVTIVTTLLTIGVAIFATLVIGGLGWGLVLAIRNFAVVAGEAPHVVPIMPPASPPKRKPLFMPQPARKLYPFDRGWRVMSYIRDHLFERTGTAAREWWFTRGSAALAQVPYQSNVVMKYWTICRAYGYYVGGAATYVFATMFAGIFLAMQSFILALWAGIAMLFVGILQGFTFLYSRYYRIFHRCPVCHEEMPLPAFICGNCAEEHTRLWPSIYGIFAHTCQCGRKLPTIEQLGRGKLAQRVCPSCKHPLSGAEGTNVHIPVVGGPSAGKTHILVTAMRAFIEEFATPNGYQVVFTETDQEKNFLKNIADLNNGRDLPKTQGDVPQAYTVLVKNPRQRVPKHVYLYDAAGEVFRTSQKINQQIYYQYIDGIIFVIDPFAIPNIHAQYADQLRDLQMTLRPSAFNISEAFGHMVQIIEATTKKAPGSQFPYPVAVVISKVDALDLEQHIGEPAARALMARDPSITNVEDAINVVVRDFLFTSGMGNFVDGMETQFPKTRYFSCSALGRLPVTGDTRPFVPVRVVDPYLWLLRQVNAVAQPRK